jgi:hypothetical protein
MSKYWMRFCRENLLHQFIDYEIDILYGFYYY